MPILKHEDIIKKGNPVKELTESLNALIKVEKKLVTQNKAVAESFATIKKSNDGAEAQKLVQTTDKLTKSTLKLKEVKTSSIRVNEQILKANTKLAQSRTKEARQLALVRQETLKNNKANRDNAKSTLGMSKGLGSLGKQLIGSLGVVGGMMAFVSVLKNAFKISVEFGKASSGLAAILRKSKSEISGLTDQAKDLGATTAFTASEVIKLQTELARLGFSLNEIKDATPAILDLGAALGVNLADAAQVSGGIVRAFGLSTQETKEVVDSMVATLNNSGAAFEDYREAVSVSAPIFKAANIDFKTMNLLIGKLADSQIKGSKAGTGLKNLVSKLSDENSKLSKELGFTVKNSDDLVKAFELLKTKNIDLTDATELTDERSKAAFLTLIQGVDSADKLSTALNNLDDNAKKTAATMLDNLAGDMTIANSAWQGFVLSLSDGTGVLSSAFRNLTQGFTSFLGGLQKINEEDFGTKMKVMANGVLSVVNAISFGGLDKALKNVTGSEEAWRFNTEKQTGALKLQKKEVDKNEQSTRRLTTAEKEEALELENNTKATDKNTKAKGKNTKAKKETRTETGARGGGGGISDSGEILGFTLPEGAAGGIDPVKFNEDQNDKKLKSDQKYLDDKQSLVDADNAETVRKTNEVEGAILQIKDAAIGAAGQILADSISFGIDAQAAAFQAANEAEAGRNAEKAEADKEILRQNLEEGLITEQEFKDQSAKIDEDLRAKNEKLEKETKKQLAIADKKKALFDVGIATAVGIARVIPNPVAMALAATLGAIQLAVVAARPIPKFAKGGEVGGESHANGGTLIEAEKKEFILSKKGYSGAEGISDLINKGLLKDSDIAMMKNNDNYSPTMLQLNGLIDELKANGNIARETNKMLSKTSNVYERNGLVVFEDINGNVLKSLTKN